MTETNQTPLDPAAILIAKTGCATPGELAARMTASQQQILNLRDYNQVLQIQKRPFQEKAERHERRAGYLGIAAFAIAGFSPVGAVVIATAAVGQVIKGAPSRAQANDYGNKIAYNTHTINQDANYLQQGQQVLVEVQQAEVAVQAAKQQQAAQLTMKPAGMG